MGRPRRPYRPQGPIASRCATTGKVRYRDAIAAGRALDRLAKSGRDLTTYLCPSCNGWHHTTHETKDAAA